MRTKHLHSEIVYALAATQNVPSLTLYLRSWHMIQITEALKTFGINDSTKNIVVVKLSSAHPSDVLQRWDFTDSVEIAAYVCKIVKGKEQPFEDKNLQHLTDLQKVSKVYKLGAQNNGKRKGGSENNSRWKDPAEYAKVIIGSIALRGSS